MRGTMSQRSMLEFNHDYCPSAGDEAAFVHALVSYLRSGDPGQLPRGVTWFGRRHHSDECSLGEPPLGWDNLGKRAATS
jgi:hypothetical protein